MAGGTRIRGCAKHFAQILSTWEGVECTHRVFTEIKDKVGRVIDRSYVDTTIVGVISSLPSDSTLIDAGWLNRENMVGFFTATNIKEHDHIIYEGITYDVEKLHGKLLDISNEVAVTVELSRVPGD